MIKRIRPFPPSDVQRLLASNAVRYGSADNTYYHLVEDCGLTEEAGRQYILSTVGQLTYADHFSHIEYFGNLDGDVFGWNGLGLSWFIKYRIERKPTENLVVCSFHGPERDIFDPSGKRLIATRR